MSERGGPRKVLIATSAGGHWVQMRRLLPAFEGCELVFAGVEATLDADLAPARYYRVRNVSRSDPWAFSSSSGSSPGSSGPSGRTWW